MIAVIIYIFFDVSKSLNEYYKKNLKLYSNDDLPYFDKHGNEGTIKDFLNKHRKLLEKYQTKLQAVTN